MHDFRLLARMAGIRAHDQLRICPLFVQIPTGFCWTYDVVSSLHDHAGDAFEFGGISNQLTFVKEALVDKVVTLNAREGEAPLLGISGLLDLGR